MNFYSIKPDKAKESKEYRDGLRDALIEFAWWKDGEQLLGCGITKLKDVLDEVDHCGP